MSKKSVFTFLALIVVGGLTWAGLYLYLNGVDLTRLRIGTSNGRWGLITSTASPHPSPEPTGTDTFSTLPTEERLSVLRAKNKVQVPDIRSTASISLSALPQAVTSFLTKAENVQASSVVYADFTQGYVVEYDLSQNVTREHFAPFTDFDNKTWHQISALRSDKLAVLGFESASYFASMEFVQVTDLHTHVEMKVVPK